MEEGDAAPAGVALDLKKKTTKASASQFSSAFNPEGVLRLGSRFMILWNLAEEFGHNRHKIL